MADQNFEFYAGGIEDGILEVLTTPLKSIGVRSFATYSGELDSADALKNAIAQQTLQYPLVMVSYAGGANTNSPRTSPVLGRPRSFRHECGFGVIVADNNAMGEKRRRRGKVFEMLSIVWNELTDRRLVKEIENERYLLNIDPFEPVETIVIPKLPNVTAICQIFDTAFRWESADRTADGTAVDDLIVGVEDLGVIIDLGGSNLPGVTFEGEV